MQRRTPGWGADLLVFTGILTATALAIHALGVFQGTASARSPLERLERLPGLVVSRIARDLGFASPTPARREPAPTREPTYRVVAGDVLSRIARRHGVSLEALVERNRLEDPDRLEVGQTLVIPTRGDEPLAPDVAAAPAPGLLARLRGRFHGEGASPDAALQPVETLLDLAEEELRAARFESALQTIERAQRLLEGVDPSQTSRQRARLEVVRATVHVAFGREPQARRSLARALEADPELALPPDASPRKLRRLLEGLRDEQAGG